MEEYWKDIEGETYFQISNHGRVRSLDRYVRGRGKGVEFKKLVKGKILTPHISSHYLCVNLKKDNKPRPIIIHREMCKAFIPNPDNLPCVNHKDENKLNNFIFINEDGSVDYEKSNLEWCDQKYNVNYGTGIERRTTKLKKKVIQKTMEGEVVKIHNSLTEAAMSIGVKNGMGYISKLCKGIGNSGYGYKWEFLNETT